MGNSEHYDLKVLAKFNQTLNSIWMDSNFGFDVRDNVTAHVGVLVAVD